MSGWREGSGEGEEVQIPLWRMGKGLDTFWGEERGFGSCLGRGRGIGIIWGEERGVFRHHLGAIEGDSRCMALVPFELEG